VEILQNCNRVAQDHFASTALQTIQHRLHSSESFSSSLPTHDRASEGKSNSDYSDDSPSPIYPLKLPCLEVGLSAYAFLHPQMRWTLNCLAQDDMKIKVDGAFFFYSASSTRHLFFRLLTWFTMMDRSIDSSMEIRISSPTAPVAILSIRSNRRGYCRESRSRRY
jgi:hypothetical protein